MKKFFVLLTTIVMLFLCVSCGDKKRSDEFCLGTNANNVYENAFSGLAFEAGESWIMYTEDEVKEVNDFGLDEEIKDSDIEVGTSVTDLVSFALEGSDSVMIKYEKISDDENAVFDTAAKAEEKATEYLEVFTNYEYTDVESSADKIDILGSEKDCVYVNSKLDGQPMCSCYVYYQYKNYLVTLELSSTDKDGISSLAEGFYLIEE